MTTQNPYFSFFPALPLSKTLRLGDWCVGYPPDDVAWHSPRFKELALTHLKTFEKQGFRGGALMWHCDRGFDGTIPDERTWAAIRATVCFIAIDANDHVRDDPNAVHYLATSENAELFMQPIDEEKAFISYQTGGLLRRVLSGGWRIGEDGATAHLPDAVVAIDRPVVPSQLHATALFNALLDDQNATNRRIGVALDWHRFALSNPRVVSLAQRLIALKTGFEALSGESATHECGAFLRRLFEDVTRPHVGSLPWAGLLWSPSERTDLQRSWMKKGVPQPVVRSELEDWFATLGAARNEIIHEGTLSTVEYLPPTERPLSRYVGQLFWTGDRLLRETIQALLGADVLLCARMKELDFGEKFGAWLRAQMEAAKAEATADSATGSPSGSTAHGDPELEDVETATPEEDDEFGDDLVEEEQAEAPLGEVGTRDLPALLAALNCDTANKVRLEKVAAQPSSTLEGADANARVAQGLWGASFAKRSIVIDRRERNLLQAAGAEFPLPRYWSRCD